MKNKLNFKIAFLTFIGNIFSLTINAQYTLQDEDVEVIDGVIESCSYVGGETSIVIPQSLDGQIVIGIADKSNDAGVFGDMELENIQFPISLEYIGNYAFTENLLTEVDFSDCQNLERIGKASFKSNQLISVDLSSNQNLKIIETSAFYFQDYGQSLTNVDLSDCTSLEVIEVFAFSYTEISTLSLNSCSSLVEIGHHAFSEN